MKRSLFNLSNYKLFSCDMGQLIPCGLLEVLPGDTIQYSTSSLVRCSPLLAPVMHPVDVRVHHFFVPYRLIWEDFEDFITGGEDGMDASVYPTITLPNPTTVKSLADYLGVPIGLNAPEVSALPFRAYAMIWNENFRDQDLQTKLVVSEASGADTTTSTALQNCAWEKDYFTSARPWEQKGPAVTVPIGDSAPVTFQNASVPVKVNSNPAETGATLGGDSARGIRNANDNSDLGSNAQLLTLVSDFGTVEADLSSATATSITAIREAFALMRFEEARARYGSRYTEYLRYYGVVAADARLQRPEYLGGGRQTIQFSEVLATAGGSGVPAVGDLKGHGIGAMRSNRFRRYIPEHGIVMSLMSIRPRSMYVQGLDRLWNRRTKEDFYQKELAAIGQQEILNKELYAAHATPDGTFGFQDRYDEYRRTVSTVGGEFRNSTLNYWHLARDFASDPALNATFVSCVPTERVFAASTNNVLYVMARHSVQARRTVPASGRSFIM